MEIADSSALLLLDLPKEALAGIDLLAFTVTPRFRGVKALPPGLHFAFVGASTAFSERHGIWFDVPRGVPGDAPPLIITKWDASSETLVAVTDEAEQLKWRANLGSIWREGLTPYRQTTAGKGDADEQEELVDWAKLTSHIASPLLSRITGGDTNHWTLSSGSSAARDLEDIPGLTHESISADKTLNFLPIDLKQTWRPGATGRERTEAAQDRSWALNDVIAHHCSDSNMLEILGELQFAFLMLLTLNNFSCLEQWKRLLTLLLTSRAAATARPELFVHALSTLTLQLQHCRLADTGLIDLTDDSGSLLRHLLTRFRAGLETLPSADLGLQDILDELDELEDFLRMEHRWQFGGAFAKAGVLELEDGEEVAVETTAFDAEDETGEYAPVVVELTAEQARMLGEGGQGGVGGGGAAEVEKLHASLSRTSLHEAATSSDGSDDESTDEDVAAGASSDEEEEETEELEDMDARY
ncbi:hypothetical protein LTR53_013172 [Teratosphaeriaceae sp. CCFEE 6253]|nr:hypothetical protein LTR53_013172 [Teratosphaeriaceae sp. CCFEE 6253]